MESLLQNYASDSEGSQEEGGSGNLSPKVPTRPAGILPGISSEADEEEKVSNGLDNNQEYASSSPKVANGAPDLSLRYDRMLETPYLWKSPAITEDFARKQFLSPADVGRASPEKATASEAEEEQSEYNEDDDDEPLDTRYFDTLPSEPPGPCDPLVQSQVGTFMDTYAGTDFTTSLKRKKDFGNPEILKKVIQAFQIDDIASNYPKSLFDPHGYSVEDFSDSVQKRQRDDGVKSQPLPAARLSKWGGPQPPALMNVGQPSAIAAQIAATRLQAALLSDSRKQTLMNKS